MPKNWIAVIAGDHAEFAALQGICAFAKGSKASVEKVSNGDRFIYYSPKTGLNEGAVLQSFTAMGEVIGETSFEAEWAGLGVKAWVKKALFENVTPARAKPMLGQLSFVPNPRYWGMAFRRGQFEIGQADFDVIAKEMRR